MLFGRVKTLCHCFIPVVGLVYDYVMICSLANYQNVGHTNLGHSRHRHLVIVDLQTYS